MSVPLPQLREDQSFAEQIAAHFADAIRAGALRAGERLPTIRAAAAELGVTRGTVQEAYRRLAEHGLVVATVGRGTVVAERAEREGVTPFSARAEAARRRVREHAGPPTLPAGVREVADFADIHPDRSLFPVHEFAAALQRRLRRRGSELLAYGSPGGSPELRRLLAARREPIDPPCDPEEILVTHGAQQGIDLVLHTFTRPGDAVAVTIPTYHHLFGLLDAHGLTIAPVRTAAGGGIDLDDLAAVLSRPRVRLLYVMPTFHNPTGRSMGADEREALMELVARTNVPVVEDEFERELRFSGEPLPLLRSLDPRGLTVTARTFSKGLFPGVRIGWLEASRDVAERMAALKRFIDLEGSPLLQEAMAEFIASGRLDHYLAALRDTLAARHAAARRALRDHMPEGFAWSSPQGGFALWVEGPAEDSGDALARRAADRGVTVTPGSLFDPRGRRSPGARLSLSRADGPEIARGIAVLGRCAREVLDETSSFDRPLYL